MIEWESWGEDDLLRAHEEPKPEHRLMAAILTRAWLDISSGKLIGYCKLLAKTRVERMEEAYHWFFEGDRGYVFDFHNIVRELNLDEESIKRQVQRKGKEAKVSPRPDLPFHSGGTAAAGNSSG